MILYNMRFRGAMEYDKFVLNYLQFYNEVHETLIAEFKNSLEVKTLKDHIDHTNKAFEAYTGTENNQSYNEKLYDKLTLFL